MLVCVCVLFAFVSNKILYVFFFFFFFSFFSLGDLMQLSPSFSNSSQMQLDFRSFLRRFGNIFNIFHEHLQSIFGEIIKCKSFMRHV